MEAMKSIAIQCIEKLSEDRLKSAVDYLRYLYEQDYPLDDFDYELARRADGNKSTETTTLGNLMEELRITHEDLQH